MADTFVKLWRRMKQYTPDLPLALCQQFINDAFTRALDYAPGGWSFQFGHNEFIVNQSIFGTCFAVQNSTTVTQVVPQGGIAQVEPQAGDAGSGYNTADFIFPISGQGAILQVASVFAGGVPAAINIINPGYNYGTGTNIPTTGGAGTGAQVNILETGNGSLPNNNTTIVGRQLLFSSQQPIANITSNPPSPGNTLTLDLPFGGITGTQNFEISNLYFMPVTAVGSTYNDFEKFVSIVDPPNNWQIAYDIPFEELNNYDPQRSTTGDPYCFADVGYNSQYLASLPNGVTDSFGNTNQSFPTVMKEVWPRQQSNYVYPFVYKRRFAPLQQPNSYLPGIMSTRGDVVFEGALAQLSAWPGTTEYPNPKLNPVWFQTHDNRFQKLMQELRLIDDSVMMRTLTWIGTYANLRYPPFCYTARWVQTHATNEAGFAGFAFS